MRNDSQIDHPTTANTKKTNIDAVKDLVNDDHILVLIILYYHLRHQMVV